MNVSPKGPIETLRVLDERDLAYLDMVGSGAETAAHVRENGRIVIMLCAFEGPPRIVRLHGRGELVQADDMRFAELLERCASRTPACRRRDARSCSCRWPDRRLLRLRCAAHELRGPTPAHGRVGAEEGARGRRAALRDYQREKNGLSIDGLPAIELPTASERDPKKAARKR